MHLHVSQGSRVNRDTPLRQRSDEFTRRWCLKFTRMEFGRGGRRGVTGMTSGPGNFPRVARSEECGGVLTDSSLILGRKSFHRGRKL